MLKLVNITKTYETGEDTVTALNDVSIDFRRNEFVSILGQSGCGKTTLLNIIGGLDRYTSGDLIIEGRTTKEYKDRDWDAYRNHSIGFVFQSYNLIPHQTALSNVELALTLSGVSKTERKERAAAALKKVGLGDQLKKKPNQMSGGQMQRVAIARALINDPEILLADEPTGALDSETSEQIMKLLKEVADDRLVIMVTHNPELAEKYSTRIVRLLDGKIVGDTMPYSSEDEPAQVKTKKPSSKKGKTSMSFFTALSLSLNNLMTKKGRTFMTSFAGSIGIIGIALILSMSSGFQSYIDRVQQETLSSYPITIEAESVDLSELLSTFMKKDDEEISHDNEGVYANTDMYNMMNAYMNPDVNLNNLKKLKAWMESGSTDINKYISAIRYSYASAKLRTYVADTSAGVLPANDYMALFDGMYTESSAQMANSMKSMQKINVFDELPEGKNGETISNMVLDQYELAGDGMKWPENKDEVVLILDKNNEISETFLYALGLLDRKEITGLMQSMMSGEEPETDIDGSKWSYADVVGKKYKLVIPTDTYLGTDTDGDGENDRWTDMSKDESYMKLLLGSAEELTVVGVIRPKKDAVATAMQNSAVGYTSQLTDWYLEKIAESELIKYQMAHEDTDALSGLPFKSQSTAMLTAAEKAADFTLWAGTLDTSEKADVYSLVAAAPDGATLTAMIERTLAEYPDRASKEAVLAEAYSKKDGMDAEAVKKFIGDMSDEEIDGMIKEAVTSIIKASYADNAEKQLAVMPEEQKAAALDAAAAAADEARLAELYDLTADMRYSASTFTDNMTEFGFSAPDDPSAVYIYASTFEDKDAIANLIQKYNATAAEEDQIKYTDYIALALSSISKIINAVAYVLIAFVSISLIVSSIMIGIITYISVLERTKEIGILRSIGASKRDISRVFNAETLIIGFVSGAIGILVTILLDIPINLIINALAGIGSIAYLPAAGAAILVAISMVLTLVAGLIPSRVAATKDPVTALRTE